MRKMVAMRQHGNWGPVAFASLTMLAAEQLLVQYCELALYLEFWSSIRLSSSPRRNYVHRSRILGREYAHGLVNIDYQTFTPKDITCNVWADS